MDLYELHLERKEIKNIIFKPLSYISEKNEDFSPFKHYLLLQSPHYYFQLPHKQ